MRDKEMLRQKGSSVTFVDSTIQFLFWEIPLTWTPYSIYQQNEQVRVRPYFSAPIGDFDQKEQVFTLPYRKDRVSVQKVDENCFAIGGLGMLTIDDGECMYETTNHSLVLKAPIPDPRAKNAVATGLSILGAVLSSRGG